MTSSVDLILLSGGVDSAALAAVERPAAALFVDYGQRPAAAERRAAGAVAAALGLELHEIALDLRSLGGGLLLDDKPIPGAPSPEWWPFRNQMLVTAAAAVALRLGLSRVSVATVAGDGDRHADGTQRFYETLDLLLRLQEGNVGVTTPAIHETSEELVVRSGLGEDVLAWTVSCHRAALPCGDCPGCWKRARVMATLGMLQSDRSSAVEDPQ
jgi:7-cyano-7-deazaguanine synthase